MDTGQELLSIQAEVQNVATPAKAEGKTFASKWLSRAYRLCTFWNYFAVSVAISQVCLLIFLRPAVVTIPGATAIYTSAGVITGALVGGEKIVEKLKG